VVRELEEGAEQKLRDVSCPEEGANIDAAKAVESVVTARCREEAEEYRQKERKASGRRDTMVQSLAWLVPFCDVFTKIQKK
jgi:hypothetical protein